MATTKYKQTIKGNKDAAAAFQRQADLLAKQIKARNQGRKNLTKQYSNARLSNRNTRVQVVKDLLAGFRTAQEGYDRSEKDAAGNLGTVTSSSRLNRAREGSNAMAEIANMGGGITDKIKAMGASLRGLNANLQGGANDYGNAITSINNSLGDLNTGTQTNINNELRQERTNNAQAFAELSAGNQQAYADLVDLYGQQGATYESMAEALADKKSNTKSSGTKSVKSTQEDELDHNDESRAAIKQVLGANAGSANAANQLAAWMGRTFTEQALTIDQMNAQAGNPANRFTAAAMKENQSNLDELGNGGSLRKLADAEGSKLRKRVEV